MSRTTSNLTAACLVIGVLLIVAGVGLLIAPQPASPESPLWGTLLLQGFWILLALCGGLLSRSRSLSDRLGLGRGSLSISTSIVLVVGFVALSGGLHLGLVSLELRETGSLAEIDAVVRSARARAPSFLLALLALGIAPGFGEEILFRGFVQRGLVDRLGVLPGLLLAASLFGLAHLDPVHSSLAFLLGVYLGVVALLAGSIRMAILCHVLNNALGVLAPSWIPDLLRLQGPCAIALLLAFAGASLLYAGRRGIPVASKPEESSG